MIPTFLLLLLGGVATAYKEEVYMDGDVVVGGLFAVQDHEGDSCNEVSPSSIQEFQAVRWFFSQLNHRNYINNVTIGFHAFKTCGVPSKATKATLNLMENRKDSLIGLIGPGRSSEAQSVSRLLSSLPEQDRLPQIVYSATATTLSDRDIYKNLYRVIVPDGIQVDIMLKLLLSLKWNYIAIVYDNDVYGTEASQALKELAEKHDICVPVFTAIDSSSVMYNPRESFRLVGREIEGLGDRRGSPVSGLVFIGQASTAQDMFRYMYLDVNIPHTQMIVSESIKESLKFVMDVSQVYTRAKGHITSGPPPVDVETFHKHWKSLHENTTLRRESMEGNDWLFRYMISLTECDTTLEEALLSKCLDESTIRTPDDDLSIYVGYSLLAAATFARTLETMFETKCPQNTGLCSSLMDSTKNPRFFHHISKGSFELGDEFPDTFQFPFTFTFEKGEIVMGTDDNTTSYVVDNFQLCDNGKDFCYVRVGEYRTANLTLHPDRIKSYNDRGVEIEGPVESLCQVPDDCSFCVKEPDYGKILFIPGDFYVVGLVPVHNKGADAFTCGSMSTFSGADLAESFSYAVKHINSKSGDFKGILGEKKVGLILIDSCGTPFITKERVMKLLRGDLQLNGSITSAEVIGKIIGFVGPKVSSNCVPFSSLMTETDYLFIGYAATSVSLTGLFNFMRTCAPDSQQADVIMKTCKTLGAKYVQIVYSDEEYGRTGRESLEKASERYGVCVAQAISLPDTTDRSKFTGYISDLRKFKYAKLVIIFVVSYMTNITLDKFNEEMDSDEFTFIGGEAWGRREYLLTEKESLVGSLTLAQELPRNKGFQDYLQSLDITMTENPWLQDFIQIGSDCYFPMSFKKTANKRCPDSLVLSSDDPWIQFAINAIYSLVTGFNKTVLEECGSFNSICHAASTSALKKNILKVTLDMHDKGIKVPVFDNEGDGNVGYIISQVIRNGTGKLVYDRVGSSDSSFSTSNLDQDNIQHSVS